MSVGQRQGVPVSVRVSGTEDHDMFLCVGTVHVRDPGAGH